MTVRLIYSILLISLVLATLVASRNSEDLYQSDYDYGSEDPYAEIEYEIVYSYEYDYDDPEGDFEDNVGEVNAHVSQSVTKDASRAYLNENVFSKLEEETIQRKETRKASISLSSSQMIPLVTGNYLNQTSQTFDCKIQSTRLLTPEEALDESSNSTTTKRSKIIAGTTCETQICEACSVTIDEIGIAIHKLKKNPEKDISEIIDGICDSREFSLKYGELAKNICADITDTGRYVDIILSIFDSITDKATLLKPSQSFKNKRQICTAIGACNKKSFELKLEPSNRFERHWNERCYVCQSVTNGIESRMQVSKQISEKTVVSLVKGMCDQLQLEEKYNVICKELLSEKYVDDITWLSTQHFDHIMKKSVLEQSFSDSICQQVKFCEKYVDPIEAEKKKIIEEEVAPVFF